MNQTADQTVITGAALATGLGITREETWQGVCAGRVAMRPMTALESPLPPGKDGGQALDLPADYYPDLPREVRYLKWTLADALRDAGIAPSPMPYRTDRCAVVVGTTLHGIRAGGQYLRSNDYGPLRHFLAGDTLASALDGTALGGAPVTVCSACSSSLGSIALGVTLLQTNQADLVIAGGYDTISEYVYGGFNSLRLVADGPLRPFTKGRKGMKLAEGYAIVVLERAADARNRGAPTLATILGWGESADAHHLTQPHPEGAGAARAVRQALRRANLEPADVDLIAAHATGTPDNDAGEYAAFSSVFGPRLPDVPVVAFKSHLGHTLGGAGAVELVLSAMALRDQVVPACANVAPEDVEFPNLRVATGQTRRAKIRATLNTSLGFGGANTCVILGPPPAQRVDVPEVIIRKSRDVLITGVGVLFPGVTGNDEMLARLRSDGMPAIAPGLERVADASLEGLLNTRRVRRMSDYVKLTLAATTLACRDAGITDVSAFAETCATVLGSTLGSSNYSESYYGQIVREGLAAANPLLFAEGVPNSGAAQLSLMLGLKEACQTVIGTRTAGLDALALAAARIGCGDWDRAIVGAGEEYCDTAVRAYRSCGMAAKDGADGGFVCSAGAVSLVLESRESVESRGGRVRGRMLAGAARRASPDTAHEAIGHLLEALDGPEHVLSSACGTWVDRAEAAALRRAPSVRSVSAIYGHVAETFSASPLAAIAATLRASRLPRLLNPSWLGERGQSLAASDAPVESFAAICTDFTGCVSGVRIAMG